MSIQCSIMQNMQKLPVIHSTSCKNILSIVHGTEHDGDQYEAVVLYLIPAELAQLGQDRVQADVVVPGLRHGAAGPDCSVRDALTN